MTSFEPMANSVRSAVAAPQAGCGHAASNSGSERADSTRQQKVAILQSNYIPWKGYFDMIRDVDCFVLYDDVQYTRRDWRNRNKIKTPRDLQWLTIPVEVKGKFEQKIKDTRIATAGWAAEHWKTIVHCYRRAPRFEECESFLSGLYEQAAQFDHLSDVNFLFINSICSFLGIATKLCWSSEFELPEEKSERLVSICRQLGATEYVSGPAAKSYLREEIFNSSGIAVRWFGYEGYPEYEQLYPPFVHTVSIVDLLVHAGHDANSYMRLAQR